MAKVVYVCSRIPAEIDNTISRSDLAACGQRVAPDNIQPRTTHIRDSDGVRVAVFSPPGSLLTRNLDTCLGFVYDSPDWSGMGSEPPTGSYVVFRCDETRLEIVTDAVGSRPAWYYYDDKLFVAGTSQRGIISVLKNFEFNPAVVPWILATGTPGIEQCFDRRLHRVRSNSTVTLDRQAWRLTSDVRENAVERFEADAASASQVLIERLETTLGGMRFDPAEWVLPLSGGYDSRTLLYFLQDTRAMQTVTWGKSGTTDVPGNDAQIAASLAQAWGTGHSFIPIDSSDVPFGTVLDRFVACSEGLVDHIGGYTDGFAVWKRLHDQHVSVIRGDTSWTATRVFTEEEVYPSVSAILWNDYQNLPPAADVGLEEQHIPDWMMRRPGESIQGWRDRLYLSFRHPVVLAALNELKTNFVEIANPLLAKPIVEFYHSLPDDLRAEKLLFKNVIESHRPDQIAGAPIGFASSAAVAGTAEILGSQEAMHRLQAFLDSPVATNLFSDTLIDIARSGMKPYETKRRVVGSSVRTSINPRVRKFVRDLRRRGKFSGKPTMNMNILAFRMFIIGRMFELLDGDAAAYRSEPRAPTEQPGCATDRQ